MFGNFFIKKYFSEKYFSKNIFRHDENKIFVQLFFYYLDYASTDLENHLEHPGAASELTRAGFFSRVREKKCAKSQDLTIKAAVTRFPTVYVFTYRLIMNPGLEAQI